MPSRFRKILTWIVGAIALLLLVAKLFFIGHYRIPQNGMYPGLPTGSTLFTLRRAYSNPSQVRRGDIIVFIRDEDGQRFNYIWRVVGLPGEKIEVAGQSLSINGQPVERQELRKADGKTIMREQIGGTSYEIALEESNEEPAAPESVTVPAGEFFVMGDNRMKARDSRTFGPIPFSSIIGRKL